MDNTDVLEMVTLADKRDNELVEAEVPSTTGAEGGGGENPAQQPANATAQPVGAEAAKKKLKRAQSRFNDIKSAMKNPVATADFIATIGELLLQDATRQESSSSGKDKGGNASDKRGGKQDRRADRRDGGDGGNSGKKVLETVLQVLMSNAANLWTPAESLAFYSTYRLHLAFLLELALAKLLIPAKLREEQRKLGKKGKNRGPVGSTSESGALAQGMGSMTAVVSEAHRKGIDVEHDSGAKEGAAAAVEGEPTGGTGGYELPVQVHDLVNRLLIAGASSSSFLSKTPAEGQPTEVLPVVPLSGFETLGGRANLKVVLSEFTKTDVKGRSLRLVETFVGRKQQSSNIATTENNNDGEEEDTAPEFVVGRKVLKHLAAVISAAEADGGLPNHVKPLIVSRLCSRMRRLMDRGQEVLPELVAFFLESCVLAAGDAVLAPPPGKLVAFRSFLASSKYPHNDNEAIAAALAKLEAACDEGVEKKANVLEAVMLVNECTTAEELSALVPMLQEPSCATPDFTASLVSKWTKLHGDMTEQVAKLGKVVKFATEEGEEEPGRNPGKVHPSELAKRKKEAKGHKKGQQQKQPAEPEMTEEHRTEALEKCKTELASLEAMRGELNEQLHGVGVRKAVGGEWEDQTWQMPRRVAKFIADVEHAERVQRKRDRIKEVEAVEAEAHHDRKRVH